jgi:peptidoglycan/xylan/chitin deacetylase (PgdA/CDA1 family)
LRCIVFHDISVSESPFTKGMGVSITPRSFETTLEFISRYYTPVCLEDVLVRRQLPARAVLVTFDDGYASVMDWAVPLCEKSGVPAVFFLNAAFLDNERLSPDNLVCFAANVFGMRLVNRALRSITRCDGVELHSVTEVFSHVFPSISPSARKVFLDALCRLGGIDARRLACEARLYLSSDQVRKLARGGFELGNHTYTHVRCRSLNRNDWSEEIERNQRELESIGKPVRAFSVPYGSSRDLTTELISQLKRSGHEAAFLSESVANPKEFNRFQIDRVSVHQDRPDGLFFEIEVLPRLRSMRNRLFGNRRTMGRDFHRRAVGMSGWPLAENRD